MSSMPKKIYIASSLTNIKRVQEIRDKFLAQGCEITYDWTTHGAIDRNDINALREAATGEMNGVMFCDVFFLVQEGRKGSHVELGLALARQHYDGNPPKIVILEEVEVEMKSFYQLPDVNIIKDEETAINFALEN